MKRKRRDLLSVSNFKSKIELLWEQGLINGFTNRNQIVGKRINVFLKDTDFKSVKKDFNTPMDYLWYSKDSNKIQLVTQVFLRMEKS